MWIMTFVLFYHQNCSECSESRHEYPESLLDALPIGIQPCSLLKQQKGQEASLERYVFLFSLVLFFFFNIYIQKRTPECCKCASLRFFCLHPNKV